MESIPDAIQEDILIRLPLKSLLACIFVCKKWKTMIYDEKFKDGYLLRSMTRPMHPTPASLFHSDFRQIYYITAPIRGVVCLRTATRVLLCNPITNNVLPLPDIEGLRLFSPRCILGYDEATGLLKVLCPRLNKQPLLYTVRSRGEGSWRPIACEPPHIVVFSCALCKGGVLYYAAKTFPGSAPIIMSFDLNSEEFTVNQLPEGVFVRFDVTMVNYNGKVALVICVRNEVSGQWELQQIVIPGWRDKVGNDKFFSFVGTIGTGDLVFKGPVNDGSESVLHYNSNPPRGSNGFKMYRIEADNGGSYHYVRACLNHFESLLRTN